MNGDLSAELSDESNATAARDSAARDPSPRDPAARLAGQNLSHVKDAVECIRCIWSATPAAAVVLGTGLGRLADAIEAQAEIPYAALPGFPQCTALAHRGRVLGGRLGELPLLLFDGRWHIYEGYAPDQIAAPIAVAAALGTPQLILSNAAGGLDPRFAPGDLMVIEDHVDLFGRFHSGTVEHALQASVPPREIAGERPVRRGVFDAAAIRSALNVAAREQIPLARGIYIGVTGPNYETRAEYRFLRQFGHAVGMSTIPEAVAGAALGMRVTAFSMITNVAAPDCAAKVDAQDVVEVAARCAPQLLRIVQGMLESP